MAGIFFAPLKNKFGKVEKNNIHLFHERRKNKVTENKRNSAQEIKDVYSGDGGKYDRVRRRGYIVEVGY